MLYSVARLENFITLCCGRPQKYTGKSCFRCLSGCAKCLLLIAALFICSLFFPSVPLFTDGLHVNALLGQADAVDSFICVIIAVSIYVLHISLPVVGSFLAVFFNGDFRIVFLLSDMSAEDLLPLRGECTTVRKNARDAVYGERKVFLLQSCLLQ